MACDTCRRRKVKCNDGRPTCDNCIKRSLNCTYLGEPGPIKKSRLSSQRGPSLDASGLSLASRGSPRSPRPDYDPGRLERLESLVHELSRQVPKPSDSLVAVQAVGVPADASFARGLEGTPARQTPHEAVLEHPHFRETWMKDMTSQYLAFIHCQPLPLFDPSRLPSASGEGMSAILSRCICQLTPGYGSQQGVTELRRAVFDALAMGMVTLEIAQALCVLVLLSINHNQFPTAQIALGAAGRVTEELLLRLPANRTLHDSASLDTIRCAQSVFILECILRRSIRDLPRLDHINHLAGVDVPSSTATIARNSHADTNPIDLGVQQYCLQLFLIWSRTIAYLDTIRVGAKVEPWKPESEYQKIMQELYAFETSLAQEHRVGNLRLEDRTPEELDGHRTYWAPWFTMQFLFHAIQALANHPLIHITKIGGGHGFRPPTFSQHTADQARLHAGWITRLVRACQEKRFQIHDPFIGHLVAAVSTVQLFWMDDRSSQVALEAVECHRTCEAFLADLAKRWPHLNNTLRRLELLAHSAAPSATNPDDARRQSANGHSHLPKHTAQLDLLLPMFQYSMSAVPLPIKTAPQDVVPLPAMIEFLTPVDRAATSATMDQQRSAGEMIVEPSHAVHAFSDLLPDGINIFDTSDILNTTMLDGSLWPGQL